MIRTEINSVHFEADKKLRTYTLKKIDKLEHFLPKHARESAHAEVFLKETYLKKKKQCTCEVILKLPHETITTSETTMNMYAAVDIVEAKLKNRVKKYKETHSSMRFHRRVLTRLRRQTD